jgi:hypothetical protein
MPMQAKVSGLSADPSAAQDIQAGNAAEATVADCTKRRRVSGRDTDHLQNVFVCRASVSDHRHLILDTGQHGKTNRSAADGVDIFLGY